ncbi:MAG: CoA pyrophosphatase [Candidatus Nanopelagicales bacterium]|nr:CoA pyrophosphatase [Candidatus Nanopelagicales bacterium]
MTWARVGWIDPDSMTAAPGWLQPLIDAVPSLTAEQVTQAVPPHGQGVHAAVLVLFGPDRDLLLIERATQMRAHAGQPAFPGGRLDPDDADAAAAAVREAVEETGLDASGVVVFGRLPDLWIPVTDFVVTPVVAWWARPSAVSAQDPAEVSATHRVSLVDLADPARRCLVRHPSGYVGPGFEVHGLLIWGFTAGVISVVIDLLGLTIPWEPRYVDLPV